MTTITTNSLLRLGTVILIVFQFRFVLRNEFSMLESTSSGGISNTSTNTMLGEPEGTPIWDMPTKASSSSSSSTTTTTSPKTTNSVEESEIEIEIDWSDKIFQDGHYEAPIVIESHKMVFFFIPKVACSVFKRLFRRMMGYDNWFTKDPHSRKTNGLKQIGDYPRHKQRTMMTSPNWTRAIFVRDPIERILSGYLDKGVKDWRYFKHHCCGMVGPDTRAVHQPRVKGDYCDKYPFTPYETELNQTNFPFEFFVDHAMVTCYDVHWNPQSIQIEKARNWKVINFVGKHESNMADTHLLLKQIGAFEEFGASGWGPFRNESIFQSNTAVHGTGASNKMEQYYTPDLRKRVFEHVRGDYEMELFNFTIPSDLL